ncbi:MAG: acylneuraminate cytidylyltransferase family protein [Lachnospiraceae bacterium]|nr:acylneuraminate cytidylyltransferase family protein [Lachnospiraceae bacterium]
MYNNKRILGLIPARGGSKGIPHKNIIDLCGKPLISYSIEAGLKSKYIDSVIVSTDDKEIAAISRSYGAEVPFMRPEELAADTSKTIDAILHAVNSLKSMGREYDTLVLLQPTQPLRTFEDIDNALNKYMENKCIPLVSVSPVNDNPLLIRSIQNDRLIPLLNASSTCRRQDMPEYYRVNGCIYINEISEINENTSFNDNPLPFTMTREHSVDIDELSDLALAKFLILQA